MKQPTREEMQELVNEIVLLKYKAGKLGMYKTMQALENGVTKVGWEMAEKLMEQDHNCGNCNFVELDSGEDHGEDLEDIDYFGCHWFCSKDDQEVVKTDCCLNWEPIPNNIKNFYS